MSQEQFAGGIARFSKVVTDAAKEQDKAARALSASLKAMGISLSPAALAQRSLAEAAAATSKQLSSLNAEMIRGGVSSKQQAGATKEATNALLRLGIGVKDAAGNMRPLEPILGDLAERYARMPDGPQKTAEAMELFGRAAGPRLIPLLNQGRAGMQDVMDQVQRMGLFVTREQTRIAEAMNDALSFMAQVARGARTQIGLVFAPVITRAAHAFREAIARNWTALQGLARDIEARIAPVIDDLIRLLEGRDSEVQNTAILAARDAIVSFARDVQGAIVNIIAPAFRALMTVLRGVATAINTVFGTELTGAQIAFALVVAKVLLGPGRPLWATLSADADTLFYGRLVGIPTSIFQEIVTLEFVARPPDYAEQKADLAATLKVHPFWDPLFVAHDQRDDPDLALEARTELWHVDRVSHDLTVSDVLQGEDGMLAFEPNDIFYELLELTLNNIPLRQVNVEVKIPWTQFGTGSIDLTNYIVRHWPNEAPGKHSISSFTFQGIVSGWPREGRPVGDGWVALAGSDCVLTRKMEMVSSQRGGGITVLNKSTLIAPMFFPTSVAEKITMQGTVNATFQPSCGTNAEITYGHLEE